MIIRETPPGHLESIEDGEDEREYQALPDELYGEITQQDAAPCKAAGHYGTIETNQLGQLQIHVCANSFMDIVFCDKVFVYSATYGWLEVAQSSPLRVRIREVLNQGYTEGVWHVPNPKTY